MFDLEEKISEWRKQMLAAGIKSPVPLDELEIHLREEIEREIKSRTNEQRAFEVAVSQIGQANVLKTEFVKTSSFRSWFSDSKSANSMKRKLGVNLAVATLFMAIALQFAGAPLIARMRTVSHQDGHTMVDNFWQIQWYAFVLAGLFVTGIVLALLPKRKVPKSTEN